MPAGRPSLFERRGKYRCKFCKRYSAPSQLTFVADGRVAYHLVCMREYFTARRKGLRASFITGKYR